jgi:hypothetical protein
MAESSSSGSPSGNHSLKRSNATRRPSKSSPSTSTESPLSSCPSIIASCVSHYNDEKTIVNSSIAGAGPAIIKPGGEASGVAALLSAISLSEQTTILKEQTSEHDSSDDERCIKFPAKDADSNRPYCRTAYDKRIVTDAPLILDESKFEPCTQTLMEQEQGQDLMPNHGIWFDTATAPSPTGANRSAQDDIAPSNKPLQKRPKVSVTKSRKASLSSSTTATSDVEMLAYAQTQEQSVKPVRNPHASHISTSVLKVSSIQLAPITCWAK